LNNIKIEDKSLKYFDLKETFRFFRQVAIKENDFITEREFKAMEMRANWNYLKSTKLGRYQKLKLWNLHISRFTNDFGRDWILPLIEIFILGIFFSGLINYVQFESLFWYDNWMLILLPIHSIGDFVTSKSTNSWMPLWIPILLDLFHRVLNGLLIFQMIKAFRFYTT
ncbi:MAG: hypothetical protein RLQ12_06120, partial [Cyclobacteriaceae bacterium]